MKELTEGEGQASSFMFRHMHVHFDCGENTTNVVMGANQLLDGGE